MANSTKHKIKLIIITQAQQLLETEVDSVSAPTTEGEITILPEHIPLFSKLQAGELRYRNDNQESTYVVAKGFIDVAPHSTVTVIVDSAVEDRAISLDKAHQAMLDAQQTIATSQSREELIMAEASLKRALLEIKVAQKTKQAKI
jgi:F-type H+-transporting ATPase subunit epsilon